MPVYRERPVNEEAFETLRLAGYNRLIARLLASRGISSPEEAVNTLSGLLSPDTLKNCHEAAVFLADAIAAGKRITVVGDYDCDGATATTLAVQALRLFGGKAEFIIPSRFDDGYGLSPELVKKAIDEQKADVIVTVDNGIASVEGVKYAKERGLDVLVTDHHLPQEAVPEGVPIVNPNQAGCAFESKSTAGVGVIFYVMTALRSELRKRGVFDGKTQPNLAVFLPLVAIGTLADVVPLDHNNRILVEHGLKRIRAGQASPGITALFEAANRKPSSSGSVDITYTVAPVLNAAGRMDNMTRGVLCLLEEDPAKAREMAKSLAELNIKRRQIENDMKDEAVRLVEENRLSDRKVICVYKPDWHVGVIGVLASKLRETYGKPAVVLTGTEELNGSARSTPWLHLKDAFEELSIRHPDMIVRYGGHALAAGVTVTPDKYDAFYDAFEALALEKRPAGDDSEPIDTDGDPDASDMTRETAELISAMPWGPEFEAPVFCSEFKVVQHRIVGEKHLRLRLEKDGRMFEAIAFNRKHNGSDVIKAVYRLNLNEFNGNVSLQLQIDDVIN